MTSQHDQNSRYFQGHEEIICSNFGCLRPLTLPEQLCGTYCQGCQQPGAIVGMPKMTIEPDDTRHQLQLHYLEVELARCERVGRPTRYMELKIISLKEQIKNIAK